MTILQSSYGRLPERFYQRINPEVFKNPSVVVFNANLADNLSLKFRDETEIAQVLSGQQLLAGSKPIAQAYAGRQFGHFVPLLGDGRAHLLGEVNGWDIQLKGSGRTRFSRRGDGRSALGPAIREFLVSEGMHALGVPTTRSLGVVTTGENVLRMDGPEPGAILTRVSDSFLRVGTFELFSFQNDHEALVTLTDYAIQRHYREIQSNDLPDRCLKFLQAFAERQANLVAKWYALGFIHGVMNTDNCSISGVTLDYGPCAFLDEFEFQKTFSSIDQHGRYAYGNQMSIAKWNVLRLAECLFPLIHGERDIASSMVDEALREILLSFPGKIELVFSQKLGFKSVDDDIKILISDFLGLLETSALDFTLSFFYLKQLFDGETGQFTKSANLKAFIEKWKALQPERSLLSKSNPHLIPRNHHIEDVIGHANRENYEPLHQMWSALQNPFHVSDQYQRFTTAPEPHERVYQTFCGT